MSLLKALTVLSGISSANEDLVIGRKINPRGEAGENSVGGRLVDDLGERLSVERDEVATAPLLMLANEGKEPGKERLSVNALDYEEIEESI